MYQNNYLVTRDEMQTIGVDDNIFILKGAAISGNEILYNGAGRSALYLEESYLPSNQLRVPVAQDFVPLRFCGSSFKMKNITHCIEKTHFEIGAEPRLVNWTVSNVVLDGAPGIEILVFYPEFSQTVIYNNVFQFGGNISFYFQYTPGNGSRVRVQFRRTDCL